MKKNKITWIAVIAALIMGISGVKAQEKPVSIGVKAGVNLSTFGGDIKDTKSVFKYQFGVTADIGVTNNFYILTGLDLQTKGSKSKSESGTIKYNPMYLQLPAHLAYKLEIAPGIKLVVNAGPYAAYGIGGKAKGGGSNEKIFGNNKFKKLDYGAGGGLGLELGKICVSGGYDLGLKNISDTKGTKVKNRSAYVTLGYKF